VGRNVSEEEPGDGVLRGFYHTLVEDDLMVDRLIAEQGIGPRLGQGRRHSITA